MFWSGELADAYQGNLRALSGEIYPGLRWTYPPPYILFVAPLALVPEWAAYLIFMGLSLTGYVAMLYAIGGRNFELSLRVSIPAISVSLAAGQNGLVFGIIIAAILRAVSTMQGWSGLGLALLMMKPQLFPVSCAYEIRERRWSVLVIGLIGLVVLISLAPGVMGSALWRSFFSTMEETGQLLIAGNVRLARMISVYASLCSLGVSARYSLIIQSIVALGILYTVIIHLRRRATLGQLGLVALASPLLSPYAYDYDLPVALVSVPFLWPLFQTYSRSRERVLFLSGLVIPAVWGLLAESILPAVPRLLDASKPPCVITLSGLALLISFGTAVRVVLRAPSSAG